MKKKTIIYLIRHAQSHHNAAYAANRVIAPSSHELGSDLSDLGIKQAHEKAQKLSQIQFSAAYSSDLIRAHKTAQIIASKRNLSVVTTPRIREVEWKPINGRDSSSIKEAFEVLQKNLIGNEKMKVKISPDQESEEEAASRLHTWLQETVKQHESETIFVVAHGRLIRNFLVSIGFARYEELPGGSLENCSHIILESNGETFQVIETDGVVKS